jgi:CRP/FNR family transcriptional regulator
VSRILRRFQDDGIVRVERRDVEILDRTRLEDIARNVLRI